MVEKGTKTITLNRKARHDFFIEESYEAGIALSGTEVKSLRAGAVNLKDSFCGTQNGELYIIGMHISPYEHGNIFNKDPLRQRKLLMHKSEILKLHTYVQRDGYSLVPLSLYFKNGRVKVQIGLAKGKKLHDKRDSEAARDAKREIDRSIKERPRD